MTDMEYQDWRRARAGLITASQFRRVMDAKTPRAWRTLLADIRSDLAAVEQGIFTETNAPALQWGKDNERRALATYALAGGHPIAPAPFVRHATLPIGASCDAYVGDYGLAEAKCPYGMDGFDRYVRDGVESVYAQAFGQLWITGRKWVDVVIYDPRRAEYDRLHVVHLERDERYIAALAAKVTAFAHYITDGTEPQGSKFAEAA